MQGKRGQRNVLGPDDLTTVGLPTRARDGVPLGAFPMPDTALGPETAPEGGLRVTCALGPFSRLSFCPGCVALACLLHTVGLVSYTVGQAARVSARV